MSHSVVMIDICYIWLTRNRSQNKYIIKDLSFTGRSLLLMKTKKNKLEILSYNQCTVLTIKYLSQIWIPILIPKTNI